MRIQEVVEKTAAFFKQKGIESSRLEAELLISHALSCPRIDLYLKFDQPLSEPELIACRELVRRRGQGEPVAYIRGYRDFYNHKFRVGPGVLIPRPETEFVVEEAIRRVPNAEKVLDIGAGTGCIGLSILKANPNASLIAVEKSQEALPYLEQNAEALELKERIKIIQTDFLEANLMDQFDLVVANPPYIATNDKDIQPSVKEFEPHQALFAKGDGFEDIKNWSERALRCLKNGGWMLFEIGSDQRDKAINQWNHLGLSHVSVIEDLAQHPRVIVGQKSLPN